MSAREGGSGCTSMGMPTGWSSLIFSSTVICSPHRGRCAHNSIHHLAPSTNLALGRDSLASQDRDDCGRVYRTLASNEPCGMPGCEAVQLRKRQHFSKTWRAERKPSDEVIQGVASCWSGRQNAAGRAGDFAMPMAHCISLPQFRRCAANALVEWMSRYTASNGRICRYRRNQPQNRSD